MISVLCTVFNSGQYLGKAIASVVDQTYVDWELLVMDDGSTDPVVHAVLSGVVDERITVYCFDTTLEERRRSCRYATLMNWGAARSCGGFLTYLAGDDYYLPDRFERMVAKLEQGNDVVYGAQAMIDERGDDKGVRQTRGILTDPFGHVDLNSVMHTRESFNIAGGWPTEPAVWRTADGYFWRRLCNSGFEFVPVDGGPTDVKRYRDDGVDELVKAGRDPWE